MSYTDPHDAAFRDERNHGLTKLEYFSGVALQGLLANSWHRTACEEKEFAEDAVTIAKAMIKELNKRYSES